MSEPLFGVAVVKLTAVMGAAAAASRATVDIIQQHEPMWLGAAESALLAAIAGALIGVYLHQDNARRSLIPADGHGWRLALVMLWRVCGLGAGVLAFAFLAAWTVTAVSYGLSDKITAAALPCAGILGAFVQKLLPKYLQVLEGIGDAVGDVTRRIIGNKAP